MKLTAQIKSEVTATELALQLAKLGGNVEMANQARKELMELLGELDRRNTVNRLQNEAYKNAKKNGGK